MIGRVDSTAGIFRDFVRGRRNRPSRGITADAQGRFNLPVPGPGAWLLTGVARGFPAQGFEAHENFAAAIVLTPEKPSAQVSFALAANAMIAGLVLDDAGEPVADATVQAQSLDEVAGSNISGRPQAAAFGQTDDRGRYELSGLAPGRYRIRVEARPWYAGGGDRFSPIVSGAPAESPLDPSLDVVYGETWYPGSADEEAGEVLTLAGGELRQADFHLIAIAAAHIVVPRVAGSGAATRDTRNWTGPLVTRDGAGNAGFGSLTGTMRVTPDSWVIGGLQPGTYQLRLPGEDGHPSTDSGAVYRACWSRGRGRSHCRTAYATSRFDVHGRGCRTLGGNADGFSQWKAVQFQCEGSVRLWISPRAWKRRRSRTKCACS